MRSSLLDSPVFLGPSWHPVTQAVHTLAHFLCCHGGEVESKELKVLYDEHPSLKTLGKLEAFCRRHPVFRFQKRCRESPALLSLGAVAAPVVLQQQQPDAVVVVGPVSIASSADLLTSHGETYQPRWMSRKVLKQQCRRQARSLPEGFKPRRRSDRRARAQSWLSGYMETFWPEIASQAVVLLSSARQWPLCDGAEDWRCMPRCGCCIR